MHAFTYTVLHDLLPHPTYIHIHSYTIYSVILLLNLLIAMLSFTFDNVREQSTLECRTAFAQAIQRLELLASLLRMRTKVGELKGDQYTIEFRSIGESVERPQGEGSSDPFAPATKIGDDQRGQAMRIESEHAHVHVSHA